MLNKLSKALYAGILLLAVAAPVHAEQSQTTVEVYQVPIHFVFDGKSYTPHDNQESFIYEGSTYVPLRFVAHSLGKAVKWDGSTYTVTIEEPTTTDKPEINQYNTESSNKKVTPTDLTSLELIPSSIQVYLEKINYIFDAVPKLPPDELPGMIYQDTLYVPMRFVSESIGKIIKWDPVTYTISTSLGDADKPAPTDEPNTKPKDDTGTPATGGPGGGSAGGGGGGTVGKPSEASLISSATSQLENLQNSCKSKLTSLFTQYQSANDADTKKALKASGKAEIDSCIAQYNSIKSNLESQLNTNGYSTAIIDEIEAKYNELYELLQQFISSHSGQ